jgi:hypothetical protein
MGSPQLDLHAKNPLDVTGYGLANVAGGGNALAAVAETIAAIGRTALSIGGALRALEVNPLWVNGDQVEALDVLVITETSTENGA